MPRVASSQGHISECMDIRHCSRALLHVNPQSLRELDLRYYHLPRNTATLDLSSLQRLQVLNLMLVTSKSGMALLSAAARTLPASVERVGLSVWHIDRVAFPLSADALNLYRRVVSLDLRTSGITNLADIWRSMPKLERLELHGYPANSFFMHQIPHLVAHAGLTTLLCWWNEETALTRVCPNVQRLIIPCAGAVLPPWTLHYFEGMSFSEDGDWSRLTCLVLTECQVPDAELPALESLDVHVKTRTPRLPRCPRLNKLALRLSMDPCEFPLEHFSAAYPAVTDLTLTMKAGGCSLSVKSLCAWRLTTCWLQGFRLRGPTPWRVWSSHAIDTLNHLHLRASFGLLKRVRRLFPHTLVEKL